MASDRDRYLHVSVPIPEDVWDRLEGVVREEVQAYLRSDRFLADTRSVAQDKMKSYVTHLFQGYGGDSHPLKKLLEGAASEVLQEALTTLQNKNKG